MKVSCVHEIFFYRNNEIIVIISYDLTTFVPLNHFGSSWRA